MRPAPLPKKPARNQLKRQKMSQDNSLDKFRLHYSAESIGESLILNADCFEWMTRISESSFHAVVTDPPYGVKEYETDQLTKRDGGTGGVWRIPPSFDGHTRSPIPRFTALNDKERQALRCFFVEWARLVERSLLPGGHVIIASNAFLSQSVFSSLVEGGLEFRGELIRVVRTLRGGDRPKNAEKDFCDVVSMPRGCYEPWGIFRKPLPKGMTIGECLREFNTGGLRRRRNGKPFEDLICSERTPRREMVISGHPSCKPQSFMRQVVHAVLPLGTGYICDPFLGGGSTVAACEAMGAKCLGVEKNLQFFKKSIESIPRLAAIEVNLESKEGKTAALL